MKKEELENYEPKGQLIGFPKEVIARMLDYQEEQGYPRNVSVFENIKYSGIKEKGFDWGDTEEGCIFWSEVISLRNFDLFFERYPKQNNQDNSQEFKVGDKVYDILLQEVGVVQDITYSSTIAYGLSVEFKSGVKSYTINGCYIPEYKNPHQLHYRDDYDYDVIDFNNLPKRQKPKRWRAKENRVYYFVGFDNEWGFFSDNTKDNYAPFDDNIYNSGNYFRTEVEAEIIAQKLNEYFKQLINQNK